MNLDQQFTSHAAVYGQLSTSQYIDAMNWLHDARLEERLYNLDTDNLALFFLLTLGRTPK